MPSLLSTNVKRIVSSYIPQNLFSLEKSSYRLCIEMKIQLSSTRIQSSIASQLMLKWVEGSVISFLIEFLAFVKPAEEQNSSLDKFTLSRILLASVTFTIRWRKNEIRQNGSVHSFDYSRRNEVPRRNVLSIHNRHSKDRLQVGPNDLAGKSRAAAWCFCVFWHPCCGIHSGKSRCSRNVIRTCSWVLCRGWNRTVQRRILSPWERLRDGFYERFKVMLTSLWWTVSYTVQKRTQRLTCNTNQRTRGIHQGVWILVLWH